MNERIKELAEQADGVFIHKLMTGAKQYTFLEKDLEKFAELIVRECLSQLYELTPPIISNENHQKLVDSTYMMAVDIGVAKIKKHFGVEE